MVNLISVMTLQELISKAIACYKNIQNNESNEKNIPFEASG